jgi:hypothetical protein
MKALGYTGETFRAEYSTPIEVTPTLGAGVLGPGGGHVRIRLYPNLPCLK